MVVMMNQLTICHQGENDRRNTNLALIGGRDQRLLRLGVPHGVHSEETRPEHRLAKTEDETKGEDWFSVAHEAHNEEDLEVQPV